MELIAGFLLVLISVAHFIYGEKVQIPALKRLTKNSITIGSHRIIIFQGGFLLLATGIIQVLSGLDYIKLVGVAQYFPVGIVFISFGTALLVTIFLYKKILKIALPQFMLYVVIISLQLSSLWE